jgi:energy-coupling factor transporter transmembrane protein EcfT
LGLALAVSSAVLLVAIGRPDETLAAFDRLWVPRSVSYAFISLQIFLPQIRKHGARQLALLRIKGGAKSGAFSIVVKYRRIVSPLLVVSLSRQLVHAKSLERRGFFENQSGLIVNPRPLLANKSIISAGLLLLNIGAWIGVCAWRK